MDLGERHELVSVDRLKPHAGPSIFTPAAAPRLIRPPLPVLPPAPPPGGGIVDTQQISVTRNKSSRGNYVNAPKYCKKYIQSNTNHACFNSFLITAVSAFDIILLHLVILSQMNNNLNS